MNFMEHIIGKKWSDFSPAQQSRLLDLAEVLQIKGKNQVVICTKGGANILADYLPENTDVFIRDDSKFF